MRLPASVPAKQHLVAFLVALPMCRGSTPKALWGELFMYKIGSASRFDG